MFRSFFSFLEGSEDENKLARVQEKSDLEFARSLQEKWDREQYDRDSETGSYSLYSTDTNSGDDDVRRAKKRSLKDADQNLCKRKYESEYEPDKDNRN